MEKVHVIDLMFTELIKYWSQDSIHFSPTLKLTFSYNSKEKIDYITICYSFKMLLLNKKLS